MLKGPKDEGLALRKKCEEILRHLSSRGNGGYDQKKSASNSSSNRTPCCSTYSGSRAQLSLKQVDALLGIDLVNNGSVSDLSVSKYWWVGEKRSLSSCEKIEGNNVASPQQPDSCATSFDDIALFIYKHGFQDLLYEDVLHGHSSSAASRTPAQRRESQEELLKSGVLRILARLLKQIHDGNFYRSPEDKIANALTISIEKLRVDREGLSADWEFYAANYHPRIPLKDKIIYVRISQEVSRRLFKRSTLGASKSKKLAPSAASGASKQQPCLSGKRKPVPTSKSASTGKPSDRLQCNVVSERTSKSASTINPCERVQCNVVSERTAKSASTSKSSERLQCNVVKERRPRKCRLKVTTKNINQTLNIIPGLTATPTEEDKSRVKQRPSSSYSRPISSEVEGELTNNREGSENARERPSTTSQTKMTRCAPCLRGDKAGRGHGSSAEPKRSNFKLRDSADDLPSCLKGSLSLREHFLKNEPDGGLSALARIEHLFPIYEDKEEDFQRIADLQVEIERLKILKW